MIQMTEREYLDLVAARDELADLKAVLQVEDNGYQVGDEIEEEDFLTGATCNPNAPEECESCQ